MIDKMREDFEAYIAEIIVSKTKLNIALKRDAEGDYETSWVQNGWKFWQAATLKANQWLPIESLRRFDGVVLMWNETANAVYPEKCYRIGHPLVENTTNCTHYQNLPLPPTGTGGNHG